MKKLLPDELNSVINLTSKLMEKEKTYRYGQAFFSALEDLYPEVANSIRGTDNDPYYIDYRMNDCIKHISIVG